VCATIGGAALLPRWRDAPELDLGRRDLAEAAVGFALADRLDDFALLECRDCGGGTGIFSTVALFTFERDDCLRPSDADKLCVENRILLKILGVIHLGDRYAGSIDYRNGTLAVGADVGWFNRGAEAMKEISVG
jgi:hypothetical protein